MKAINSDNPGQEIRFIRGVFGEDVSVTKDVFHVIKELSKLVPESCPLKKLFTMELGNCFFEYFNKDMEEHRQALQYSNEDIDKLMSSVKYLKVKENEFDRN